MMSTATKSEGSRGPLEEAVLQAARQLTEEEVDASSGAGRARERLLAGQVRPPHRKDEAWRFVNLKPYFKKEYRPLRATDATEAAVSEALDLGPAEDVLRLVVLDGKLFDAPTFLPEGLELRRETGELGLLEEAFEEDWFVAVGQALAPGGFTLEVLPEVVIEQPVHLIFVHCGAAQQERSLLLPRVVVRVQRGSKLTLIEEHLWSGKPADYATVALAEVEVEADARLDHVRVQREAAEALHVGRLAARLGQGAHYRSVSVAFGGGLSRMDVRALIDGGAATCDLHGLAVVADGQQADTHTILDHRQAHSDSNQLHKCVVAGRGHAVFNGTIFVRDGAQLTNAFQLNRNLLLDDRARVDTKPQLEIWADDVKCSHGATIGQLEADQLFYLQARGLERNQALELLTFAFAAEVLDAVEHEAARRSLEVALRDRLGRMATDAIVAAGGGDEDEEEERPGPASSSSQSPAAPQPVRSRR